MISPGAVEISVHFSRITRCGSHSRQRGEPVRRPERREITGRDREELRTQLHTDTGQVRDGSRQHIRRRVAARVCARGSLGVPPRRGRRCGDGILESFAQQHIPPAHAKCANDIFDPSSELPDCLTRPIPGGGPAHRRCLLRQWPADRSMSSHTGVAAVSARKASSSGVAPGRGSASECSAGAAMLRIFTA